MIIIIIKNIHVILQTVAAAKLYYSCEDIEGVYLENEGGGEIPLYVKSFLYPFVIFKFASSHWEKRTLNHELMNGYLS